MARASCLRPNMSRTIGCTSTTKSRRIRTGIVKTGTCALLPVGPLGQQGSYRYPADRPSSTRRGMCSPRRWGIFARITQNSTSSLDFLSFGFVRNRNVGQRSVLLIPVREHARPLLKLAQSSSGRRGPALVPALHSGAWRTWRCDVIRIGKRQHQAS